MRLFPEHVVNDYLSSGAWVDGNWTDMLAEHVAAMPNRLSIVDPMDSQTIVGSPPRRLTWAEVDEAVAEAARTMYAAGIRADDVVGVQLPNVAELAVTYLAIVRLGAIITPFPIQYRHHELATLGSTVGMRTLITMPTIRGFDHAGQAHDVLQDVPNHLVMLWQDHALEPASGHLEPDVSSACETYVAGLDRHANDCVTISWTSGTTGLPKGVPRTAGGWSAVTSTTIDSPQLTRDDVILNGFPMVNAGGVGGMFVPWITKGCTLVQHHPFNLDLFLKQVDAERVTYTCAPPVVLNEVVSDSARYSRYDLTSLRTVGTGSAPISAWMIEEWERVHGVEVVTTFGSNEGLCLYADAANVPDPAARGRFFPRFDAPGIDWRVRTVPFTSARLVDLDSGLDITEPGRSGELRIKGPTIFSGYWGSPHEAFDEHGYFCSGDLFEIAGDRHQYLHYVDRIKDLVNRGGFKISTSEIESLVLSHPSVAEVAAVGMPDTRLGERLCLFVAAAPGAPPVDLAEIIGHLEAAQVAKFKLPERLVMVDALPRNPVGKVVKASLRDALTT